MLNRIIAFSGVTLIAAFILTPSKGEDPADLANGSASMTASGTAGQPASNGWYAGVHTLTRSGDGHFYAQTEINGVSLRLLVDTGASVVALTADDARDAGLTWNPADVSLIGRGASGDVYGVSAVIDTIDLGGITQSNVQAVIIPEGLDTSLLGQSFLSKIKSVEIVGGQMALENG
ncbi:retropepsin-like aspartic protease family protein [Pontixanthobacter sp.]|uniref:retropepsin-like aspartic protease family protein n=1 Tax=Pontixanthobacter sp. TaxID=2792078 RepID=UPI003C7C7DA0